MAGYGAREFILAGDLIMTVTGHTMQDSDGYGFPTNRGAGFLTTTVDGLMYGLRVGYGFRVEFGAELGLLV